jgi:hypothetical protein
MSTFAAMIGYSAQIVWFDISGERTSRTPQQIVRSSSSHGDLPAAISGSWLMATHRYPKPESAAALVHLSSQTEITGGLFESVAAPPDAFHHRERVGRAAWARLREL